MPIPKQPRTPDQISKEIMSYDLQIKQNINKLAELCSQFPLYLLESYCDNMKNFSTYLIAMEKAHSKFKEMEKGNLLNKI